MSVYAPDEMTIVKGFSVEIVGATGKEVDTAWESVSGGELVIESSNTTVGSDKFQTTSPGHKTVGEITLRGAMTDKRAALCTWINETVQGKPWKRTVSITPTGIDGPPGPTYIFLDCVLTAYAPPRLRAAVPNDPSAGRARLIEEVRFTYRD